MKFDYLIRLFGQICEEKISGPWGPGIRRSYRLGPLRAVSDEIFLYHGGLLHMKHSKCIGVTPGWIIQKNDQNMPNR